MGGREGGSVGRRFGERLGAVLTGRLWQGLGERALAGGMQEFGAGKRSGMLAPLPECLAPGRPTAYRSISASAPPAPSLPPAPYHRP